MPHYSVVQLVGTGTVTDPFRPPTTEEYQIIDLRPLSAQEGGKVDGFALVATPERVLRLGLYLGDSATEVSRGMARSLSNRLGLNLDADPTLGELIGELLTRHATGENDKTRWNPVQGSRVVTPQGNRWLFEAYLGGDEPVWSREVLRADGGQQYSDSFARSNASTPGGAWTVLNGVWTIASQKLVPTNNDDATIRYDADLQSDDHASQFDFVSADANFRSGNALVRMNTNNSSPTYYATGYLVAGGSYEVAKRVNGNSTNLFAQSGSNPQTSTIRSEIRGSTLKGIVSGTTRATVTDTSIPTGKRTGIFSYQSGGQLSFDNYLAADFQATFAADATIGSTGLHRKTVRKNNALAGTVGSSGVFSKIRAVTRFFTGAITPGAGIVKRAFTRAFAGNVNSFGAPPFKRPIIGTNLAGTAASSAKIKFTPIRRFAGTIASAGNSTLKNVGRVFGEAGFAKVWNEVTGEIRSWISKG